VAGLKALSAGKAAAGIPKCWRSRSSAFVVKFPQIRCNAASLKLLGKTYGSLSGTTIMSIAQPSHRETQETETVEQFLARGGRVERIEEHPDPEGRVLRRGQRADEGRRGIFVFQQRSAGAPRLR
jgi:hypothetical protein